MAMEFSKRSVESFTNLAAGAGSYGPFSLLVQVGRLSNIGLSHCMLGQTLYLVIGCGW